jgi:hypothetical protein
MLRVQKVRDGEDAIANTPASATQVFRSFGVRCSAHWCRLLSIRG